MKRWSKENLEQAIEKSYCVSDVCRFLGITATAANYRTFHKYRRLYNLECSHFDIKARQISGINKRSRRIRFDNESIFVIDSTYPQARLKKRVIDENLIKYECQSCGILGEWNGKPLTLQLDHINGVNNDNRINNLRFLCPNCHTQTDTYTSKKSTQGC